MSANGVTNITEESLNKFWGNLKGDIFLIPFMASNAESTPQPSAEHNFTTESIITCSYVEVYNNPDFDKDPLDLYGDFCDNWNGWYDQWYFDCYWEISLMEIKE